MADEIISVKRHLTLEDFKKWDDGTMTPKEMEAFLSHTAACDTCSENWMSYMAQQEPETLPQPPAYLAGEIIERSKQPDIMIARKVNRTSKQIRLLTYSLKVGTAVALSIVMLFSINLTGMKIASVSEFIPKTETPVSGPKQPGAAGSNSGNSGAADRSENKKTGSITDHMRQGTQNIMSSLDNFTQSIFNLEFNFNQEDD